MRENFDTQQWVTREEAEKKIQEAQNARPCDAEKAAREIAGKYILTSSREEHERIICDVAAILRGEVKNDNR